MDKASSTKAGQLNEPLLAGDESSPMADSLVHQNEQGAEGDHQEPTSGQPGIEEEGAGGAPAWPSPGRDEDEAVHSHEDDELPWYKCPLQLIAMLSNYSTSYNVVNISMVIPILKQIFKDSTSEDVALSASSLLAGMILGQLLGGRLGDSPTFGRLGALQLVMALQVIASIGASLLWTTHISRERFYVLLAIFRFLLGVGAGGVYPLAAVLSAEQGGGGRKEEPTDHHQESEDDDSDKQVRRVVLTFSTQGLGFISAPMVTVPLLYMTTNLDLVWRIILALGSLPGLALMIAQLWIYKRTSSHQALPSHDEVEVLVDEARIDSATNNNNNDRSASGDQDDLAQQHDEEQNDNDGLLRDMQIMEEQLREGTGIWDAIRREPNLVQKLLGTAGTWFFFDVLFYGNTLFEPIVMDAAFGGDTTKKGDVIDEMRSTAIKSLILTSIALPGYAVAGIVMGKRVCCKLQTPKYVMLQGFAAMGTLYLAIGLNWSFLRHTPALLIILYGLTFFFANYGPNTTTFILPSLVFSPECRTTLNGVSAAAGKLGALTGASLFEPAAASIGNGNVMLICAGVAVLSFLMTWRFVQMHPTTPNPV